MIHISTKIDFGRETGERKRDPVDPVTFRLIKYATIISVRSRARSGSSRCLFRDASKRALFRKVGTVRRENGEFSARKLVPGRRDPVTLRLIKYATIISSRTRTRSYGGLLQLSSIHRHGVFG